MTCHEKQCTPIKTGWALKRLPVLLYGLFAAGTATFAWAQEPGSELEPAPVPAPELAPPSPARELLNDGLVLNLGVFVLQTDTSARLNGESSINTDIDFERAFGRNTDSSRLRADALWRITPTQHLRLMYFNNTNTRARTLDENIEWGDYTFQLGAHVESVIEFETIEIAYEYAFLRRPTYEVAAAAGLHYTGLSLQLSGDATFTDSNGNTSQATFTSRQNSVPVPVPAIGLRAGWAVSSHCYLDAQGQFFKAQFGEYNGYLRDLRASATWMFARHYGIGVGYNRYVTSLNIDKASFDGRLRFGYSGVQAFLTATY
jgi:hypothetical protein